MPRPPRTAPGGFVYHVLNRANGKLRIFDRDRDYVAFERILAEVQERIPMRILAWCLMPNHWHLLLWPLRDNLVQRAEHWRWGSLWRVERRVSDPPRVSSWPLPRPRDWLSYVNEPAAKTEVDALRRCARRGAPYGNEAWTATVAEQLGLRSTLRPRGRPPKKKGET